ncbi:MAG: hypothetical protein AYP45_00785 [Candidatus Brocadia carolinensis]|uniref:Type I restriction modification DNA specificity domain-containing protein n=1 Tax=Candidatus Brocadia carolinensis TaxID=1004156 RepID=A0A1V4AXM9_9BACT|nr:MAG: hypothetical protein AYP45_00785 [Candidatus Brocadia caroliniensis]
MEVKKGYKKTEVGVIPEEWEVKKLGDCFTFSGGYTASRDQLSNDGYCYLHYGDIHGANKTFIDVKKEYSKIPKLNVTIRNISPKSLLNEGDVVFVDASEDDEGASKHIVVFNSEGVPFISGLHTIVSKSKNDNFDSGYKRYCFQPSFVKSQFKFYAVGTKVTGISKTNIAKILIPLPTKAEQTAIATALSDADALISSLEKLIAKKRNIKQGAMQQLLTGKKRLPGFSGKWEVKDNGQLKIKNGKLGDLFQINQLRKPIGMDEIVTFIGMEDISEDGKIIKHNLLSFAEIKKGLTYFQKNDVLVAKITPCFENGKGACLDNLKTEKGFGSTEFYILRANNNSVSRYIFYHTQSKIFRRKLEAEMVGSAGQKRVPSSAIFNYPLSIVHSKAEQIAIAQVLSDMDAEIEALEMKLEKYKMIKQGLMQNLLTGKIRLI